MSNDLRYHCPMLPWVWEYGLPAVIAMDSRALSPTFDPGNRHGDHPRFLFEVRLEEGKERFGFEQTANVGEIRHEQGNSDYHHDQNDSDPTQGPLESAMKTIGTVIHSLC